MDTIWILIVTIIVSFYLFGGEESNYECISWTRDFDVFSNAGATCQEWRHK